MDELSFHDAPGFGNGLRKKAKHAMCTKLPPDVILRLKALARNRRKYLWQVIAELIDREFERNPFPLE